MAERSRVTLSQTEECEECGSMQDVLFVLPAGAWDVEDVDEIEDVEHTCTACGHTQSVEYSGWTAHNDAG